MKLYKSTQPISTVSFSSFLSLSLVSVCQKSKMFVLEHLVSKIYTRNDERVVPWQVVPVHIRCVEVTQRMDRIQDTIQFIHRVRRILTTDTINIRYEELISVDDPTTSILYQKLEGLYVRNPYRKLITTKTASIARSMTISNVSPIFIVVTNFKTYVSRQVVAIAIQDINNRELDAAVRASTEEDEDVNVVPADKSAIDNLEKVVVAIDGRCSVCLEDFEDATEEIARMPCSHIYHTHCIKEWLGYNHVCPLCRFEMPTSIIN